MRLEGIGERRGEFTLKESESLPSQTGPFHLDEE